MWLLDGFRPYQYNAGIDWEATNWNGACDELAKIAKPTLLITGTDDND
jgi:hypothetical protein